MLNELAFVVSVRSESASRGVRAAFPEASLAKDTVTPPSIVSRTVHASILLLGWVIGRGEGGGAADED
jgi:hypothetical protein